MLYSRLDNFVSFTNRANAFQLLVDFYHIDSEVEKRIETKKMNDPTERQKIRYEIFNQKYGDLVNYCEPMRKNNNIDNDIKEINKILKKLKNNPSNLNDVFINFDEIFKFIELSNSTKIEFDHKFIDSIKDLKNHFTDSYNARRINQLINNIDMANDIYEVNEAIFLILKSLQNMPEEQTLFAELFKQYKQNLPNIDQFKEQNIENYKQQLIQNGYQNLDNLHKKINDNIANFYSNICYFNNNLNKSSLGELSIIAPIYAISEIMLNELTDKDVLTISPQNDFNFTECDFLLAYSLIKSNVDLQACNTNILIMYNDDHFKNSILTLFREINKLQQWGEKQSDPEIKQNAHILVEKLQNKVETLFKQLSEDFDDNKSDMITEFKKDFINDLYNSNESQKVQDSSYDAPTTILANIAIAATGVGLIALAIKAAYSYATLGHVSLFFQKELSNKNDIHEAVANI